MASKLHVYFTSQLTLIGQISWMHGEITINESIDFPIKQIAFIVCWLIHGFKTKNNYKQPTRMYVILYQFISIENLKWNRICFIQKRISVRMKNFNLQWNPTCPLFKSSYILTSTYFVWNFSTLNMFSSSFFFVLHLLRYLSNGK